MNKNQMERLAMEIRQARSGESQDSLAQRCDITSHTIYSIEKQRTKNPHPRTIAKIAIALDLDPNQLLSYLGVSMLPEDVAVLRRRLNSSEPRAAIFSKERLKAITISVVGGVVAGLEKKYAIQVDHNQITRIVTDYVDKIER